MTLPRYTQARKLASGRTHYRFNPPQRLIDAGVVERVELGTDLRTVKSQARELNEQIDMWRKEQAQVVTLGKSSPLSMLVDAYYQSNDFNMLRNETKRDYKYFLSVLTDSLGDMPYKTLTTRQAKVAYEEWVKRGVQFANHVCTCASRVYRYAIDMEYAYVNPFASVKRKTPKPRRVVWSKDDVRQFLDTAYSQFDYRNVGLIVHMTYEWCQRLGDMRMLTWDMFDLAEGKLYLEQSKRRAQVTLPISDDLKAMLVQQHEDFSFQKWVAPRPKPVNGEYEPYSMERLSKYGRQIMREANLSDELRLMDLRRTGTTEMIEAGVGMAQIMSVTGHSNPQSVKPYMKNTYASANYALTERQKHDKSTGKCHTER
jgi:integrase